MRHVLLLAFALCALGMHTQAGMLRFLQDGDRFTVNNHDGGIVTTGCRIHFGTPEFPGSITQIPEGQRFSLLGIAFDCVNNQILYRQGPALPRVVVVNRRNS